MIIKDISSSLKWKPGFPRKGKTRWRTRAHKSITTIAIHHAISPLDTAPEVFNNYHISHHGWPRIGYHYVIQGDGTVWKTNNLTDITYHVGNSNNFCIGICLCGNFDTGVPTSKQLDALIDLCNYLVGLIPSIKGIKGHHDLPGYSWKSCPGKMFYDFGCMKKVKESVVIKKS